MNNEMYTMMQYWSAVSQSSSPDSRFPIFLAKTTSGQVCQTPISTAAVAQMHQAIMYGRWPKLLKVRKVDHSRPSLFIVCATRQHTSDSNATFFYDF